MHPSLTLSHLWDHVLQSWRHYFFWYRRKITKILGDATSVDLRLKNAFHWTYFCPLYLPIGYLWNILLIKRHSKAFDCDSVNWNIIFWIWKNIYCGAAMSSDMSVTIVVLHTESATFARKPYFGVLSFKKKNVYLWIRIYIKMQIN